jgi:hypothetical protein
MSDTELTQGTATMTFKTICNFFLNGNEKMLLGLPVSEATIKKHFTYYAEYGVYEMNEFLNFDREYITVTNGIVTAVFNDF